MKEKNLPFIQRQKGGSPELYRGPTEKEVHQTIKIPSDVASILCRQEGWE